MLQDVLSHFDVYSLVATLAILSGRTISLLVGQDIWVNARGLETCRETLPRTQAERGRLEAPVQRAEDGGASEGPYTAERRRLRLADGGSQSLMGSVNAFPSVLKSTFVHVEVDAPNLRGPIRSWSWRP